MGYDSYATCNTDGFDFISSQLYGQTFLILSKKYRTIQNISFKKNSYYRIATNNVHSAGSVSGMLRSIRKYSLHRLGWTAS